MHFRFPGRVSSISRSSVFDAEPGALALFNANLEVRAYQRGSRNARRIVADVDTAAMTHRGLFDDDLVGAPLRPACNFHDLSLAAVLREMVHESQRGCPNGALFAGSLSVGVALHLCRTRGTRPHARFT